ncbi:hypothetical protein EVAR_41036_1 [Eumeta japonica]|uniref:Uncharacterized protein n=1 Tax=Eumeta variegata TaxID=151549 RepID=A0A4C1Z0I7_EUMVA|nr:hypothetical protein EVAR_41036_1 [Eumeta japonica]
MTYGLESDPRTSAKMERHLDSFQFFISAVVIKIFTRVHVIPNIIISGRLRGRKRLGTLLKKIRDGRFHAGAGGRSCDARAHYNAIHQVEVRGYRRAISHVTGYMRNLFGYCEEAATACVGVEKGSG